MENKSVVFVVQENNRIDYSDAERFGRVVFCTSREYRGLPGSHVDQEVLRDVRTEIESYNPDTDHIIFTGGPVVMGYVFHLLMARFGFVRYLHWDGKFGRYTTRVFQGD